MSDGTLRTRVGEGVALGFDGNAKPTLTVAGAPLNCSKRRQQSVSSVGWVAVGVATVTLAAVGFALWIDEIEDNSD